MYPPPTFQISKYATNHSTCIPGGGNYKYLITYTGIVNIQSVDTAVLCTRCSHPLLYQYQYPVYPVPLVSDVARYCACAMFQYTDAVYWELYFPGLS